MRILESQSQRLTSWLTLGKSLHPSGLSFLYKENEDNRMPFWSAVRIGWEPCMEQGLSEAAGQDNPAWVSLYCVDPGCLADWYFSLWKWEAVFLLSQGLWWLVAFGGGDKDAWILPWAWLTQQDTRKPCLHLLKVPPGNSVPIKSIIYQYFHKEKLLQDIMWHPSNRGMRREVLMEEKSCLEIIN